MKVELIKIINLLDKLDFIIIESNKEKITINKEVNNETSNN